MERISIGGRQVPGFALGAPDTNVVTVTPAVAAVGVGVAAGLLAAVLKAPLWGSIVAGCGAALFTKVGIDKAAERTA
jgi:hypothetical protein